MAGHRCLWIRIGAGIIAVILGNACSGTATGGGEREACGTSDDCPESMFCSFEGGSCDPGVGVCSPRCEHTGVSQPTCGCDGNVYDSNCEASSEGVAKGMDVCPTPPGLFPCGWLFCDPTVSYCLQELGDTGEVYIEDGYTCSDLPMPDACPYVDCTTTTVEGNGVTGTLLTGQPV